ILFSETPAASFLELLSYSLFSATLVIALFSLFVSPPRPAINFLNIPLQLSKVFLVRFLWLIALLLLGFWAIVLFRDQEISVSVVEISRTIYITALSILVAWFLWA